MSSEGLNLGSHACKVSTSPAELPFWSLLYLSNVNCSSSWEQWFKAVSRCISTIIAIHIYSTNLLATRKYFGKCLLRFCIYLALSYLFLAIELPWISHIYILTPEQIYNLKICLDLQVSFLIFFFLNFSPLCADRNPIVYLFFTFIFFFYWE